MKLSAVALAISAATQRLGSALSVEAESTVAAVSVQSIRMAYEIGQFILRVNLLDPIKVDDGLGVLSEMFIAYFKTKTDNVVLAEEVAMDFYKNLTDGAGLTDHQIMDFFKSLVDHATADDHYAAHVAKPQADAFEVMEDAVVSFYKSLVDAVGLSDDEVIAFSKTLVDGSAASDKYVAAVDKSLTDGAGLVDSHAKALTKLIQDQITATDDFDGVASVNDDETMEFMKQTTDAFAVTDLFYRLVAYVRNFEDTAAFSDHLSYDSTKLLSDVPIINEQISKDLAKAPITDQFAVTDKPSLGAGLVKQDSTLFTDTGSLRSQGYCEFSYFAEDYVGASRTF
jgi:hypothetical protein